jgi:hypothetical protein
MYDNCIILPEQLAGQLAGLQSGYAPKKAPLSSQVSRLLFGEKPAFTGDGRRKHGSALK